VVAEASPDVSAASGIRIDGHDARGGIAAEQLSRLG
jgi:hypothetical protein